MAMNRLTVGRRQVWVCLGGPALGTWFLGSRFMLDALPWPAQMTSPWPLCPTLMISGYEFGMSRGIWWSQENCRLVPSFQNQRNIVCR